MTPTPDTTVTSTPPPSSDPSEASAVPTVSSPVAPVRKKPGTVKSLGTKLAEIMAEVERVPKNGRNEHFGYDFATESDVTAAVRKGFSDRNLVFVPSVESVDWHGDRLCTVHMTFIILDGDSSETLTFKGAGQGQDPGDKAVPKGITSAVKYALLKLFLIPTGDDPESDPRTDTATVAATAPAAADPNAPACPECQSPMRQRTARSGANAGRTFWGCTRYPDCTGIRNVATDEDNEPW